jgi:hypothetical protein
MIKKSIFFSAIILVFIGGTSGDHLEFNQVPLDGHPEQVAIQLAKTGFIITDSTKRNEIILSGNYLHKDHIISILGTDRTGVGYKVIVRFPVETLDSLQSDFGKIQAQLNLKYGPGTSRFQKYKKRERLLYNVPGLVLEIREGDFTRYTT